MKVGPEVQECKLSDLSAHFSTHMNVTIPRKLNELMIVYSIIMENFVRKKTIFKFFGI